MTGCGKNSEPPPTNRQLNGEVFVVLESRETLKLSLVEVMLVNGTKANQMFESYGFTTNSALIALTTNEHLLGLSPKRPTWTTIVPLLTKARSEAVDSHSEANREYEASLAKSQRHHEKADQIAMQIRRQQTYKGKDETRISYEIERNPEYKYEIGLANEAWKRRRVIEKSLDEYRNTESFLDKLESQDWNYIKQVCIESRVKTDSDGRFSVDVPAKGDYFLWADVVRTIGGKMERLTWFIPITDEKVQKVILANDNLFPAQNLGAILVSEIKAQEAAQETAIRAAVKKIDSAEFEKEKAIAEPVRLKKILGEIDAANAEAEAHYSNVLFLRRGYPPAPSEYQLRPKLAESNDIPSIVR